MEKKDNKEMLEQQVLKVNQVKKVKLVLQVD
jgi:hypothetical protein